MRYDAEHKARTRERVLKEAALAIRTDGPEALGVAEVMKRSGLTHGGFYAHFSSREALLNAAVEAMFAGAGGVFERFASEADPREALKGCIRAYVSRAHRDARENGCPLPTLSGDLPRMTDAARERFAKGVARLTGMLAARLEVTGCEGAPALASSVLAEMVGAVAMARAIGPSVQSDELLANTRLSLFSRLGLNDTGVNAG